MRFSTSGMLRGLILAGAASLLAACGGGGGGGAGGGVPGGPTPANEYKILMNAARTQLPVNLEKRTPGLPIGNPYAGIGLDSLYTTSIAVSATRGNTNDPIPGGEGVFACSMDQSLEFGSLYYLDGDDDHEVEYKIGNETYDIPGAFRSVVLNSNAGAATFHFHASDQIGTARITCSVTDPQSGKSVSTSISINVGRVSSGKAAVVQVTKQNPEYLFIQGLNGPTQNTLAATIRDEALQPVPDSANNLCARIVSYPNSRADESARLLSGGFNVRAGQWIRSSTTRGEALFSVVSGDNTGPLAIEVRANRDGSLAGCDTFDIKNIAVIPVVDNAVQAPLTITAFPVDAYIGEGEYLHMFTVANGLPPYFWSVTSGQLPPGLTLTNDGALFGTPTEIGTYNFRVRVEDGGTITDRYREESAVTMTVWAPVTITTGVLPRGTFDTAYSAVVAATGGRAPFVFAAAGLPMGLVIEPDTGRILGTVPSPSACTDPSVPPNPSFTPPAPIVSVVNVTATDVNGRSARRSYSLTFGC